MTYVNFKHLLTQVVHVLSRQPTEDTVYVITYKAPPVPHLKFVDDEEHYKATVGREKNQRKKRKKRKRKTEKKRKKINKGNYAVRMIITFMIMMVIIWMTIITMIIKGLFVDDEK